VNPLNIGEAACCALLGHTEGGHEFWESIKTFPPLHPMLVNFTAALVPISILSDVLGSLFRSEPLRAAGWLTLVYAAIVTPFTALAGWFWFWDMGHVAPQLVVHKWLGTAFAGLVVLLAIWRTLLHRRGRAPDAAYILVACVLLAGLIFQGHLGATMSF